ncbi:MAG: hypothetical protein H0X36_13180 [Sphingomonadaceae bacterium]|nr:hypothetical protein [Sphingomonadaceae bacterium]
MFMRISSALLLLALAGCGTKAEAPRGDMIDCALDGAAEFAKTCTVERGESGLTVRRPDAGFRRFTVTARGVETDGAEIAEPQADGSVKVGADRYRLPK